MRSNGIPGVRAFRLILVVGKRKNKPVTLGEAMLPLLSNYTNARHAAPQYFLNFENEVVRNFLQDDFLGLPEHT